ncbi:MAG TPA: FadR family transcriptional regulator [Firmicutes bacterium]|nr:FadR family transcriptional regulator [Bacillota bacterium]
MENEGQFKPIRTKRVYEAIVEQVRQMVVSGVLKPGDKLISERELADKLKVSRASVREALSVLEMLGLTESRPGEGTFIREGATELVIQPFALMVLRDRDIGFELLEVRKVLEVGSARLAAERATQEDLKRIASCLEDMKREIAVGDLGDISDFNFHFAVAESTKNSVLVRVMSMISDLFAQGLRSSRLRLYTLPEMGKILLSQHAAIYHEIAARNPEAAAEVMYRHLAFVEDQLRLLEGERLRMAQTEVLTERGGEANIPNSEIRE